MNTTSETTNAELDEQVATEIFGWKRIDPSTNDGYETIDWVAPGESPVHGGSTPWLCNRRYIPSFSTNHNHAADVTDKMHGYGFGIEMYTRDGLWHAEVSDNVRDETVGKGRDVSLPRAICLAALAAVRATREQKTAE
jgi:hypothetical protein